VHIKTQYGRHRLPTANMGSMIDLPSGDSSTLRLVHPTQEEKHIQFNLNGAEWRGALSLPAYLRREDTLSQQPLTRDGGITYWILVDTALKGNPFEPASGTRLPLASCETYRKRALVWQDGKLHENICHGIGSVFCASHLRKRGYAQRMMRELCTTLRTYQAEEGKENLFSVLYSDIGKVGVTLVTRLSSAHGCRNSTPSLAGSRSIHRILPFRGWKPKA
jgi:hypothetical protein